MAAAAAALLALPVLAGGLALSRIDPETQAPRLLGALGGAAGREVSLRGPLRLRWTPWPVLVATGVGLANLPGGSRPLMATVERVEARIAVLPLLRHRLLVTQLTLVGPNILFEPASGVPNWFFDRPRAAAPSRWSLRIAAVSVINGMVTYRFPARTTVVGLRRLDYRHAVPHGPLTLRGTLVYSDFKPFTLSVRALPTGGPRDPWLTTLGMTAFDAMLAAQGRVDLLGGYALRAQATVPRLEALNALLPALDLPALHGVTLDTRLDNPDKHFDLPAIGASTLRIGSADLSARVPGLHLAGISATIGAAGPGQRAVAAGTARLGGHDLALAAAMGMPSDPAATVRLPATLRATATNGDRLDLAGTVGVRGRGFDGLSGALDLELAEPGAWWPAATPVHALRLHGRLVLPATRDAMTLQDATLSATELAGTGTVRLGGVPAGITASLHLFRLDLDALLPGHASAPAARPAGRLIPDTPLPWPNLVGPRASLDLAVDRLGYAGRSWPDVSLAADLSAGRLRLDRLALSLPGGQPVRVSGSVEAARAPVAVALSVQAPAVPLALVFDAAGLPGPVSGALAVRAALSATGSSARALAASLSGPVSLTLAGGRIGDAALAALAAPALKQLRLAVPPQGDTPIRCLGLAGQFGNGLGRFPVIALDTGILALDGHGEIDLRDETLALKLHPLAGLAGSRVVVPVLVDGSLRAPSARLEASGLDKAGLLIDALFGGDHPRTCEAEGLLPGKN